MISQPSAIMSTSREPPASMTTTTIAIPSSSSLPIRHCGNVHIRGRIRRVWRPRRLELLSDGHLLFYDNSKSSTTAARDLKYTLRVTSARILDVMTIRDMHTGLPRGTFGFLVRGKRLSAEGDALDSPSFEVLPIVEDNVATNSHGSFAVSSNIVNHVLKESFVLAEAPAPQPVRDYLCAVESLEQAQMWVVALQWAAQLLRMQDTEDEHWWKIDYSPSRQVLHHHHSSSTTTAAATQLLHSTTGSNATNTIIAVKEKSAADTTPRPPAVSPPAVVASAPTKTLVTKATGYTIKQTSRLSWSFAYEIHVLCLLVDKTKEETPVEEWTVYKTAMELEEICTDAPRLLQRLPRSWKDISLRRLDQAVSVVDSVLRSFALAADTVGNLANVLARDTRVRHHVSIPTNEMDSYVRTWLQHQAATTKQKSTLSQLLRLQQPHHHSKPHWIFVGGAVAIGIPLAMQCSRYIVPMRVDCLVLSWAGAVYLGYRYGSKQQQQQQKESAIASKKKSAIVRKAAVPSSVHEESPTMHDEQHEGMEDDDEESEGEAMDEGSGLMQRDNCLSSPLPRFPDNGGTSCWTQPSNDIFFVRGTNYFKDRLKIPSDKAPLECLGVDFWLTDYPERHIARHPDVLGGTVLEQDTLVVNFLLPFANFVAYFKIPPLNAFPEKLRIVWTKFLKGDQQYRDARLKLLPVVVEGPWIVKTAVGPGKSPALLGKVIPLQYFFLEPTKDRHGTYEIDIIITASSIAKGILSVVKSQTKSVTIAFALIIEASEQSELPENILCSFQVHSLHLEECPHLTDCNLDDLMQ